MENQGHYFKVGFFVTIILLLFFGIFIWFSNAQGAMKTKTYIVRFDGSVSGLDVGAKVTLKGISVGTVKSIGFGEEDQVEAFVDLRSDSPIRTDTIATLQPIGITGLTLIALTNGGTSVRKLRVQPGEQYPIIRSKRSSIDLVLNTLPETLESYRKVGEQLGKILNDENVEKVSSLIDAVEGVTAGVNSFLGPDDDDEFEEGEGLGPRRGKAALNELFEEGQEALTSFKMLTEDLRSLTSRVYDTTGTLGDQLSETLKQSQKTVEKLQEQSLPEFQKSLRRGRETLDGFSTFIEGLRQDPSSLVYKPRYKGYKIEK